MCIIGFVLISVTHVVKHRLSFRPLWALLLGASCFLWSYSVCLRLLHNSTADKVAVDRSTLALDGSVCSLCAVRCSAAALLRVVCDSLFAAQSPLIDMIDTCSEPASTGGCTDCTCGSETPSCRLVVICILSKFLKLLIFLAISVAQSQFLRCAMVRPHTPCTCVISHPLCMAGCRATLRDQACLCVHLSVLV